jgi:cytochrome c biogenesis protein CcmG, thiol:disulfide interchange protein DsbE
MIRNLLILILLSGAAIGYTLYSERVMPAPTEKKIAPAFSFETLDDKKHSLADFDDKVVVLNFWASWCAPCVIEFPHMMELAKMTESDSVFVFLSIDEEKSDIERFMKKNKIAITKNILIAHDERKIISRDLFRTYKIPETYIIAPGGMIADKITGADIVWDSPDMVRKIKSLKK